MNPTQAKLFLPSSVFMLSKYEIYIADSYNNRIRKISNGIISTYAMASQKTDLNIPIGMCGYGNDLFISTENEIIELVGSYIYKKVGGLGDGLNVFYAHVNPTKILFYPDNRMLISESSTNRIRLVNENGTISTIAGTGKFGYGGDTSEANVAILASPTGLSFSPNYSTVYFADSSNNRIRKLVSDLVFLVAGTGDAGKSSSTDPFQSKFNNPRLIATLTNGDVVIGDTLSNEIRIISNKEGTIRTIADITAATDMISTQNNTLYISTNEQIIKATPRCETGFQLVKQNTECVPICYGKFESGMVCSSRGECTSPDNCKCWNGLYTGKECEIPICFGISANDPNVCSYGNGTCMINNQCQCLDGFYGETCQFPICFSKIIGESCGGPSRGACTNKDVCKCGQFYTGEQCQYRMCQGKSEMDKYVCSGHGKCQANGRCECDTLYIGDDCSNMSQIYGLSIASALIIVILTTMLVVSLILGVIVYRKNRREKKIIETELSLDERLLSSTDIYEMSLSHGSLASHATASTEDPSSFVIPLHKIGMDKPIKVSFKLIILLTIES